MATTVKGRIPNYGDPLKENYGPWTIANQPQGPNNPLLLDWIAEKFGNAGLLEAVIENQVVSGGGVPRSDAPFISTLRNNNKQTPNKDDIKVVIEKKMPQPLATPREPPSVSQPAGLNWQPFKGLSDTVSRGNPLDATEYRNPLPETSLPDGLLSAQDATGMGRGNVLGDEPPVDEGTEEKGLLDRAGDFISRKWEGRDKTPMDSPMNRGLIEFGLRAMNPDSYYGKDGFGIGALGGLSASAQGGLAQHDKITEMLARKAQLQISHE